MSSTTTHHREIELLKTVKLQSSNKIATSGEEFDAIAYEFPKGTHFIDYGKGDWSDIDDDSYETPLHGWCYTLPGQRDRVNYCNFHAYILDYWPERKDLFREVA